ncbi:MAG TPA: hypothetical protein VHA14_00270 [Bryobacteraceae bacterium]|nr:hypothetical protein [Bryobacteraceae bacterium]
MSPATASDYRFWPAIPRVIEEIDVSEHLLIDIAMRHIYLRGTCSIETLAGMMKLSIEITETVFRRLVDQKFIEVRRMVGDDYIFALSPAGRTMSLERSATLQYSGPIPVSLAAYSKAVRAQTAQVIINRESLRDAFHDIILNDGVLDSLGPALVSQRSLFLHGPSGTGKTTISERLSRVYKDAVLVPYAIEVDGQIITIGDPAVHQEVPADNPEAPELDRRWMHCRRPFLAVGGELVTSMLDLQRDDGPGTYVAPLQMKANNGILLIDDFGRQMISPRDLLNRWIVPLDRRVDFLSLGSGRKFDVPFEVMVVFSTNLQPSELADDAFLRRIPNKVLIPAVDAPTFDAIFRIAADASGMECDYDVIKYCREVCLRDGGDLRPCYPRDLCSAMRSIAIYEGRKPVATRDEIDRATKGYFV